MIYLLLPHDTSSPVRVFGNFGMIEQVILREGNKRLQWHLDADWCTAIGYENECDEFIPIWVWYLGESGTIIRRPFKK